MAGGVQRAQQMKLWKEWTGTSSLYRSLSRLKNVDLTKVEFLESYKPTSGAIFQYIVLIFLQMSSKMTRLNVMDVVSRFRATSMSGYITVYSIK